MRSGRCKSWILALRSWPLTSSRNCFVMANRRPASSTSASPSLSIAGTWARKLETTCSVSAGAPSVGGCADCDHRFHLRQGSGGRQHGRAAERMADQQSDGAVVLRQVSGGAPEILHIRGKVAAGELPARRAEPGKVKAQHSDSASRELGRDPLRGEEV